MSIVNNPFYCDGCKKRRENDSNHWWVTWLLPTERLEVVNGVRVMYVEDNIVVSPWDWDQIMRPFRKHHCGLNCLMKEVERFTNGVNERTAERMKHNAQAMAHDKESVN